MKKLTEQQLEDLGKAFVTADYVAAFLHVNRRTVCNWLSSGRLPGVRPNGTGRWLIARSSVDVFLRDSYTKKIPKRPLTVPAKPPSPMQNQKAKRRPK